MLVRNNSTLRPYTLGSTSIAPLQSVEVSSEWADDIALISDLQILSGQIGDGKYKPILPANMQLDSNGNVNGLVDPKSGGLTSLTLSTIGQSKIFGIGSGGTSIGAGATIVTQHPAEFEFIGAQLLYQNQSASAFTVTTARIASTPLHQDIAASATWNNVTFNGSASGTCSASPSGASSDTLSSYLLSDFIPCLSVARTDNASKTPLLQARSYFSAAANGLSVGATDISNWNAGIASYGRQFAARSLAGDATNTFTASQQPLEAGTWIVPATVIFHYPSNVKTINTLGDSLTKGHLTTGSATSWSAILGGMLRASSKRYAVNNIAWTGQTSSASIASGKLVAQSVKPDYMSFFGWSPNDTLAASVVQATFDASYARAVEMVNYCRRNGIIPIVCTSAPYNSLNASQNTMRRNNNTRLMALESLGAIVLDFSSVLENPANNARINPIYDTGDGLHYNDAGHLAMATYASAYF